MHVKQVINVKQVLVILDRFPDGKGGFMHPRKGKLIVQGAHASNAFLIKRIKDSFGTGNPPKFSEEELAWMEGNYKKICVKVDNEEQLLNIFNKARSKGLRAELITDDGLTEFNNIPTNTCVAIGPHKVEVFDSITGHLKLL